MKKRISFFIVFLSISHAFSFGQTVINTYADLFDGSIGEVLVIDSTSVLGVGNYSDQYIKLIDLGPEGNISQLFDYEVENIIYNPVDKVLAGIPYLSYDQPTKILNLDGDVVSEIHDLNNVIFSNDGALLYGTGMDYDIKVYDWRSGTEVDSLVWNEYVTAWYALSNNRLLVQNSYEGNSIWMWQASTGKEAVRVYTSTNDIKRVLPSDEFVIVVENLEKIDYHHRVRISVLSYEGDTLSQWEQKDDIEKLVLSSDGTLLAVTDRLDNVLLWEGVKGKFKALENIPDDLEANEILFSPDGSYLLLSGYFELLFFSIEDRAVVETLQLSGNEMTLNGPLVSVLGTNRYLVAFEDENYEGGLFEFLFDGNPPKLEAELDKKEFNSGRPAVVLQSGHLEQITSFAFAGEKVLFSGDRSGRLIKWNLKSGLHFEPLNLFGVDDVYGSAERALDIVYNDKLNHLAVTADGNVELLILDTYTMQQRFSIPVNDLPSNPSYSSDGQYLAFEEDLKVKIWQADSARYSLLQVVPINASVNDIRFIRGSSKLAVADVTGSIHIIDRSNGSVERVLTGHDGGVIDLDVSEKEGQLYSVDFNSNIFKWDMDTFEKKVFYESTYTDGRIMEAVNDSMILMHTQVKDIELSADGKELYSIGDLYKSTQDLQSIYSVLIWDTNTGVRNGYFEIEEPSGIINTMAASDNGKLLATGGLDQTVRIWDTQNTRLQKSFGNPIPEIEDAIPYYENEVIISTISQSEDYYQLQHWDLSELRILKSLDGIEYGTDNLVHDPDLNKVGTAFAGGFKWVSVEELSDSLWFDPNEYYMHMHGTPEGSFLFAYDVNDKEDEPGYNPIKEVKVDVYDTETKKKVYSLKTDGYINVVEYFSSLIPRFNIKRELFLLQSGVDQVTLFDYHTGVEKKVVQTEERIMNARFSEDYLYLWHDSLVRKINLDTYQEVELYAFDDPIHDPQHNLAVATSSASGDKLAWVSEPEEAIRIGRTRSYELQIFDVEQQKLNQISIPEVPQKLFFSDNGKKTAAVFRNQIALYSIEDAQLVGSMVPIKEKDYFFFTPDFFYASSRNAYSAVGFQFQNQMISFDQLDLWYNRPDILMSRLEVAEQEKIDLVFEAYTKRLNRAGFEVDTIPNFSTLPVLEITGDVPLVIDEEELKVGVQAIDERHSLSSLHAYVNGVPIWGQKGKSISGNNHSEELELELLPGFNKIQLSVRNEQGLESLRETVEVEYRTEEPVRQDLYLVSINVSDYLSDNDLEYARKDGQDLTSLYIEQAKDLYSEIHVDTLFDDKVTLERIEELHEKLAKTRPEDQVILFISGHGLLDSNYDFYFATYDTDFSDPAGRGISYDEIEGLLDGIPARRKLLLIDACHSGEVDTSEITENRPMAENVTTVFEGRKGVQSLGSESVGLENSFDLMQQLFANLNRGSGTVVISAAAGNSYALESDEWRNGVFTYSILDGLKNMNADLNQDKNVTVSELREYVYAKVVEETGGRQTPTTRQENLELDFRVW